MSIQNFNQLEEIERIKESPRGCVIRVRNPADGTHYILRRFSGDGIVYRKLRKADCPYLPKIYEVTEQDGQIIVLEEFIDGINLATTLKEHLLSNREARKIRLQLCRALRCMHNLGIVHRDIKPANIILRNGNAVLIDFDAARLYEPGTAKDTQVLGTVGYAAPEQFGLSQSDQRVDIYAMGVLLNVLLTGKHPAVDHLAPRPMRKIIQCCTMMNPGDRYQTVAQLKRAFRLSRGSLWIAPAIIVILFALISALFFFAEEFDVSGSKTNTPSAAVSETAEPTVSIASPSSTDPSTESQVSTQPIDPLPTGNADTFPIDTTTVLPYSAIHQRINGEPSEGITFTQVQATKSSDGIIVFTVEFIAEQSFYCAAFEPPNDLWRVEIGLIDIGQCSVSFSCTVEEICDLNEILIGFANDSGCVGETIEEQNQSVNYNAVHLEGDVLRWICS